MHAAVSMQTLKLQHSCALGSLDLVFGDAVCQRVEIARLSN